MGKRERGGGTDTWRLFCYCRIDVCPYCHILGCCPYCHILGCSVPVLSYTGV